MFGATDDFPLTKTPLLRHGPDVVLDGGQHGTSHGRDRIAHDACTVLHFKYFAGFSGRTESEAAREEHSGSGHQYKAYRSVLRAKRGLSLYEPGESVPFESAERLVELGLIEPLADADADR